MQKELISLESNVTKKFTLVNMLMLTAELLLVLLPESDILQIRVRQIFVKKIP
jgi:hypothetical protein